MSILIGYVSPTDAMLICDGRSVRTEDHIINNEYAIKIAAINPNIAIGVAGNGNAAEVFLSTIRKWSRGVHFPSDYKLSILTENLSETLNKLYEIDAVYQSYTKVMIVYANGPEPHRILESDSAHGYEWVTTASADHGAQYRIAGPSDMQPDACYMELAQAQLRDNILHCGPSYIIKSVVRNIAWHSAYVNTQCSLWVKGKRIIPTDVTFV